MGDGDEVSHWCHRASRARLNIRPDSRFAFLARSILREGQRPQRHARAVRALRLLSNVCETKSVSEKFRLAHWGRMITFRWKVSTRLYG
jgi:hypothetical protein